MWLRHWNLTRDPFATGGPFVSTPTHDDALRRLVAAIDSGERSVRLVAPPGMGRSTVLDRALAASRSPTLRVARANQPADSSELIDTLARSLRLRVADPASCWRALRDAVRLIRAQRGLLVLAVDDARDLDDSEGQRSLERLARLDPHPDTIVRLVVVADRPDPSASTIPLAPLTRTESAAYLAARLAHVGRHEPAFTPRASTVLHNLSGGAPSLLHRYAAAGLRVGASHGLSIVGPEAIESLADPNGLPLSA